MTCLFCRIAAREIDAVTVHEDEHVIAFLDIAPIRPGHTLIVPRRHVETFEQMPADLSAHVFDLGQRLARRMKIVYGVERVAFFFTGTDIAHAHAHVLPMHQKSDVTSARYVTRRTELVLSDQHLKVDRATLLRVRDELDFRS